MILELDIGNSHAKWRLLDGGLRVQSAGCGSINEWLQDGVPTGWVGVGVQRVRASSVISAEIEHKFANKLASALGLTIEYARSGPMISGMQNGYESPSKLGADRWLAALAAYKIANAPVLVADIGSALTIDVVDRDGCHRGGYIIPGPRLMQGSLLRDTDRVRFNEFASLGDLSFGRDTEACVVGGVGAAQAGAVLVGLQRARLQVGDSVRVFLTGGWGLQLDECLRELGFFEFTVVPELVLDGLRWALP